MEGDRRSRILGGMSADARNVTIALVSTVVFFTVLVLVITNSPGWPEVKRLKQIRASVLRAMKRKR